MRDTITRDQFIEFTNAFVPLMKFGNQPDALRDFTLPVGPATSVTVRFIGPLAAEHFERLISQLETFKAMTPANGEPPATREATKQVLAEAADRIFGALPA